LARALRLAAVAIALAAVAGTAAAGDRRQAAPQRTPLLFAASTAQVRTTVTLAPRTLTAGCVLAANPDRNCSPGAYYRGLTKRVLCSSSFHTGDIRNVPDSVKHAVEVAYGLEPRPYGSTLEIDHIISLELGGSNDISNLFPERADARPGFRVKDKLENKLHALVCAGTITLSKARHGIAENWQALYTTVYGAAPSD
jgi:hypothetical protein